MIKPRVAVFVLVITAITAAAQSATSIDSQQWVEPSELVKIMPTSHPLIFQVGPRTLYAQAHIPGAEYIGAASQPEGIQNLRRRVEKVPKTQGIVLYCGCCPWDHCPNVGPAYEALKSMGFKNVKVLHITQNFGADWVEKGLPTGKGAPAAAK
jgi:rhodanese-related sulfurtransferase